MERSTLIYRQALEILRRRWWLLLLGVSIAVASGALVNRSMPERYESTVRLIVGHALRPEQERLLDVRAGQDSPLTYAELATSRPVLEAVIAEVGLRTDPGHLARDVRVKLFLEAKLLDITVSSTNPETAAAIAGEIGEQLTLVGASRARPADAAIRDNVLLDIQALSERSRLAEQELGQLNQQIAAGPASQAQAEALSQRRDALAASLSEWQRTRTDLYGIFLRTGIDNSVTVVGHPTVPPAPVTPGPGRTLAIAALLGLGLATVVAVGLDVVEKRARSGHRLAPGVSDYSAIKAK